MSEEHSEYSFPDTNNQVVKQIFVIEVALRELIIEELTKASGPTALKQHLPPDVYQKCIDGVISEKACKTTNHVDHHPLYYVDFPDIAKILGRNWKLTFSNVLPDKESFLNNLRKLEPIRNKCAHNRKLTFADADIVTGILAELEATVGIDRMTRYVTNFAVTATVDQKLENLRDELDKVIACIQELEAPITLEYWPETKDQWWFDDEYLFGDNQKSIFEIENHKLNTLEIQVERQKRKIEKLSDVKKNPNGELTISDVKKVFSKFEEYCSLPRGRGSGHHLESWKNRAGFQYAADQAKKAMSLITCGIEK